MRSAPREFAALALVSIPLWLVFEFYNRFLENWHYVDLPDNALVRYAGYAWAYATIWPAIFEAAELFAVWRGAPRRTPTARPAPIGLSRWAWVSIAAGVAMLAWPIVRPSRYMAAPVWLGFVFLLDPINAHLGGESLMIDWRQHRWDRTLNLALSGLLCGALWEFWNFWARSKWHYTVPIMDRFKLFEMPLPGYLGFPAFALECFTMYVSVRLAFVHLIGVHVSGSATDAGAPRIGRTIAL